MLEFTFVYTFEQGLDVEFKGVEYFCQSRETLHVISFLKRNVLDSLKQIRVSRDNFLIMFM